MTMPAPLPLVPFSIPVFQKATLDNGLRVILLRNNALPLINIRLVSHFGEVNDAPDRHGLIGSMAALMTEGAGNLTSKQIAEKVESLGASIGSSSSADSMGVSMSCLSHHIEDVLAVFSDVVLRPSFPEQEVGLFKANTLEGLKYQRAQPSFLADERFSREVYGDHPYSCVSSSPEFVASLDRNEIADAHGVLGVANCTLVVVGDFELSPIMSLLNRYLGGLPGGSSERGDLPRIPERRSRKLILVDRPGSAQSNIVLGHQALPRLHPDFFPIAVMNQILGAGASSRLFMNLREEKGFTYGAYSKFSMRRFGGDFEASAEVRTEVTRASLEEFFSETERIGREDVSDQELSDAKSYLTGVFPLRLETQEGLTNAVLQQVVFGLDENYLQDYRGSIESVSVDDVRRVAKQWIQPTAFAIVVVGDASTLQEQLSGIADDVEVFNTDGQRTL